MRYTEEGETTKMAKKQSSKRVHFESAVSSKSLLGLHLASETVNRRGDDFDIRRRFHFASDTNGETLPRVSQNGAGKERKRT